MRRRWLLPLLFASPVLGDTGWQQIQKRGVLRVAADPTLGLPYFERVNPGYQGFEWDILQAIGQFLKVEVQITEVLWAQQRQVLSQGTVDLIFNAQEAPDLKKEPFLLTRPYYLSTQTVLSQRSIEKLTELVGSSVGVLPKSGGAALVEALNLYKSRGGIKPFSAATPQELLLRLQQGQLTAVILDAPYALWLKRKTKLVVSPLTLLPIPLVGVVRDASLKNALDQGLQHLIQTGTLGTILRKWQLWNALQTQAKLLS